MKELYSQIDDHIKNYENGTITVSGDIEHSMHKTVRQITHYILSRYLEGTDNIDPLAGKRRQFRNVGNAIVDIEWRAKNIDRKSIEGHSTDGGFEFNWRAAAEGGVKALGVADGVDEDADGTSCAFDVLEAAAIDFLGFEGFMKLSALALSQGLPGLLVLTVMPGPA